MSAHKLRRGFAKEIDDVFADASVMQGAGHPDEIRPRRDAIEALRKELWTTIRELQKAAKGSAR
jgi:hypothetical protein